MAIDDFEDIRILDNFYQTSSFFPMPVVLITTISESGQTNVGPYSLCFPYIIAGNHAMILICRSTSNTAKNIKRTKFCAINFIPHDKKMLKNCVSLGFPGETTEEKMKNSIFSLIPSKRNENEIKKDPKYPDIVGESIQVFECTWDDSLPTYNNENSLEAHFILKINKIVMKKKWKDSLLEGNGFPSLPVDFGFRDNTTFWFSKHSSPYSEPIPKEKEVDVSTIIYAARRTDPDIEWTEDACAKLVNVPRIFLKRALKGCVEIAKEQGVKTITSEFLDKVRDKRSEEK